MAANCVRAPASKLTTERENPPATGIAPPTAAAMLLMPSAVSSRLASIFWRRRAARTLATDTLSTYPTSAMRTADGSSATQPSALRKSRSGTGSPPGIAPTTERPYPSAWLTPATTVEPITITSGAILPIMAAVLCGIPRATRNRAIGLRASSNSRIDIRPNISVGT